MMRRVTVIAGLLGLMLSACGTSVFSMDVGMCFDDENLDATEVSSVPEVDCAEPHDNEVFHIYEVDYASFPGVNVLQGNAEEQCLEAFDDYVGIDYYQSDLEIFDYTPTEASWDNGDREVVCVLYQMDFDKLEGSMAGAAR